MLKLSEAAFGSIDNVMREYGEALLEDLIGRRMDRNAQRQGHRAEEVAPAASKAAAAEQQDIQTQGE